ncbi:RNA polymerase subunit sigma-54 [Paracoccus sp. (in: a-proteobacteria)]|uniref:RNA polymerase factor sigma-54 n=1 Tax=Paracoccus sp. TaxID=267 RepID=UPI003A874182
MTPTLGLEVTQRHAFALHRSMALLRMSTQELTEFLLRTAHSNPLLVVRARRRFPRTGNSATDIIEATARHDRPGLYAHVLPQLSALLDQGGKLRQAVIALAEELAPSGWLSVPLDRIADRIGIPQDHLRVVLRVVQQRVEPTGLFARDLRECLTLQLREQDRLDPPMLVVLDHLPELERGGPAALAAKAGLDADTVRACLSAIRRLDPKPGARFDHDPALMREPDARVVIDAAGCRVEFDGTALPRIDIASTPRNQKNRSVVKALTEAQALKHAIDLRQSATQQVIRRLVEQQQGFFLHGSEALKPLEIAGLARLVGFHASTVSRVLNGFLLDTPHGVIAARDLCCGAAGRGGDAPSRGQVMARIRAILTHEDPARPVSDTDLARMLNAEGITVSRRLVTKYRLKSGILPASARRQRA